MITSQSFQESWVEAVNRLSQNQWCLWNLIVHIIDPTLFAPSINHKLNIFADTNGFVRPKGVAYTIFPHKFYSRVKSAQKVYDGYNNRMYPWTRTRPRSGWGTYFHRMINYDGQNNLNQLDNIIRAINKSDRVNRAAYTMVIAKPGGETVRPRGAPCLNYIAIQMEHTSDGRQVSLLSAFRHHDFLKRAYGNYWGLCNLLNFLAIETNSLPGSLTCVSSRAYVDDKKRSLRQLMEELFETSETL